MSATASTEDISDYYAFLGVVRDASAEQIKLAYRKRALQCHPDRAAPEDKEGATTTFQRLGHVYSVLSNARLREIYDRTGSVLNEEFADYGEKEWDAYFRQLYPKLTQEALQVFEAKYKGSDEELEDLKEAYQLSKGDMGMIIDSVMLATADDEGRIRARLLPLIEAGTLPSHTQFVKEDPKKAKQRQAKARREAKEAEEHGKEQGLEKTADDAALAAQIQRRGANNFEAIISRLEDKHGGAKGKRKGKAPDEGEDVKKKKAKKTSTDGTGSEHEEPPKEAAGAATAKRGTRARKGDQ